MSMTPLQKVTLLADAVSTRQLGAPVPEWMWGPALQGWALALLQKWIGDPTRYEAWLNRFCEYYLATGPAVHSSDTVAPALVTYELERQGNDRYAGLTDVVVEYLRDLPLLHHGGINHLGTSFYSRVYPDSVWVDSLMMVGTFAARWAGEKGDAQLLARMSRLPQRFAEVLRDPETGLWSHSWWFPGGMLGSGPDDGGRRFPRNVLWARGNAWVVVALPTLWEEFPGDEFAQQRAQIEFLAEEISAAMLERQRPDGSWTTVLDGWPRGYPEVSATALMAAGWFTGMRLGLLDRKTYEQPAYRALEYALGAIRRNRAGELELVGVSGGTIPVPLLPRLGYLAVPRKVDRPWGVAAVILAAIAEDMFS